MTGDEQMPTGTPMPGDPGHGPIVRHGRHPWAVVLLLVFLASGVGGLIHPEGSSPILVAALGRGLAAWYVCLAVGSLITLGAVLAVPKARKRVELPLSEKPLYDVLVERIGMVVLATVFGVYGAVLILGTFDTVTPPPTLLTRLIMIGLSAACLWRAGQITVDLRRLRKVLAQTP